MKDQDKTKEQLINELIELRQRMTELGKSEECYRNLVECVRDVIYTVSLDGTFTSLNPAFENITGWSCTELIGKPLASFVHPDDWPLAVEMFERMMRGVTPPIHEVRVRKKSGEYFVGEFAITPDIEHGKVVGVLGVGRDITERKRAEEVLRESEENFRVVVENASDAILVGTRGGSHVYANQQAAEITGYCVAELLKTTIKDLVHPDELEKIMEIYRRRLEGEPVPGLYETTIIRKDGKSVPIEVAGAKTVWQAKTADMVFFRDITERKKAEEALRESKEFTENLIASMQDGLSVLDSHGVHIDVNPAFCQMTGFSREELFGVGPPHPYWPPEAHEETERAFQKTLRGEFSDIELTFMRKNGERFPVIVSPSWVKDKQGNVTSYFATVKDITERKLAEEALKESEIKYRNIFENVIEGIFQVTSEGRFRIVNPALAHMYRYSSPEEMIETITDIGRQLYVNPDERFEFLRILHEKGSITGFEVQLKRKDGSTFWASVNIRCVYDENGNILYHEGTAEDITERKRAEEKLWESEQRYRSLFDGVPIGLYRTSPDGRIIDANLALVQILGYPDRESLQAINAVDTYANAEDRQSWQVLIKQEGLVTNFEKQLRRYDGSKIWVEENTRAVYGPEGEVLFYEGSFQDITERKRAEEEVWRYNEELTALNAIAIMVNSSLDLQQILDQTLDKVLEITKMEVGSLYLIDPQTEELVLATYKGSSKEFGDQVRTFKLGESIAGLAAQSGKPIVADDLTGDPRVTTTLVSGEGIRSLAAIPMKSKNKVQGMINIASYTCHSFTNEEIDFYTAIANQIGVAIENARLYEAVQRELTERKQAEEALRESEERYRTILDNTEYGYFEVDIAGNFTFFNNSLCIILGYPRDEMMGMNNRQYMDKENAKKVYQAFNRVYTTGEPYLAFDWEIVRKDGAKRFVETLVSLIRNSKGEGIGFRGIGRDITERKRAEEVLRETQELLTSILDNAPMLIYVTLPDNRYRLVNRGWEEFVRLTREEAVGRLIEQVFSPKTACQFTEANQQVIDMGIPVVTEEFVDRSDGSYYFHTVKFPLRDTTGKVTSVGGISFDITERKRADEEKRRLEERSRKVVEDIFRFIPEGVLVFSRKMELLRQNQAFRELVSGYAKRLGFAEDELENLIIDKIKAGMGDKKIKEIRISRKHET